MDKSDLDRIVKKLKSDRVFTLILGPEFINIDSMEVDITMGIQDYLINTRLQNQVNGKYFSEDGFLLIEESKDRNQWFDVMSKIQEFYQEKAVSESYELLSKIPFTSIISLSPDDLLKKAYEKINKDYMFYRFSKSGFEDSTDKPSKEKPLIYNLMGLYSDDKSMVFTFNSLFEFLDQLFQNTVSTLFRENIQKTNDLLFLGFNYNKWYLKLCFYIIKKIKGNSNPVSYAIFDYKKNELEFDPKIKYYEGFHELEFSLENEKEFIISLYEACREEGILSEVKKLRGIQNDIISGVDGHNRMFLDKDHKYKILFFTASPDGKKVLKGGEQYQEISKAMNKKFYELLEPKYNLVRNDIASLVNTNEPNLLYFHCHGDDQGNLILTGEYGQPDYMPLEDLKNVILNLLELHKQINCIVFSACKSERQAREISRFVPYCIGMSETVLEEVSNIFTKGFFEAFIKDSQNFENAFKNGVYALQNSGITAYRQYYKIPALYKNGELYKQSD